MTGPGHDPGRAFRDAEREDRGRWLGHRHAVWAAQSVAAADLVVVIYGVLAAGMIAAAWAGDPSRPTEPVAPGVLYGSAIALLVAGLGILALASERVVRGAFQDGQGVHLGLLLGAGGSALVSAVIVGVGLIDHYLRRVGIGTALGGCACVGGWPAIVAAWNLLVLVRHGHRLRREDVPAGGGP